MTRVLRESVARAPERTRYASVRARSAYVGSGTRGESAPRGGPAWRFTLVPRRRERADLGVGTRATGRPRGRRGQAPCANGRPPPPGGVHRLFEVPSPRGVAGRQGRAE